ncbi:MULTISPECIES: disulfide oxidoreductase [unclassified Virgibacillus]|uniref:disulfide oxidoreductase n=1 Tax=unclassified Virgibacillus TaxID=2620237 RepID=UPI0024DE804F|nr:disulfide oxidoreductase [Virgibacillus sp. LDC-1]
MISKQKENLLLIMWITALLATTGSLYFSEIAGFIPCELCWVQRVFMYPLVIIYGVALWKKKQIIALPGILLSGLGLLISIYHYLIQKLPALQEASDSCGLIPCNVQYVNYLGFITIPFLAGTAFLIIFITHILLKKN